MAIRAIRAWLKRRKERENIWPMYYMSQHVNKGSWPCGGIRCIVGSDSGLPWFHWILLSGTFFLRRCKPTMDIWWCSDGQFLFPFFFSFFALISTHVFLFFPANLLSSFSPLSWAYLGYLSFLDLIIKLWLESSELPLSIMIARKPNDLQESG
jgi:hypothetical protein